MNRRSIAQMFYLFYGIVIYLLNLCKYNRIIYLMTQASINNRFIQVNVKIKIHGDTVGSIIMRLWLN